MSTQGELVPSVYVTEQLNLTMDELLCDAELRWAKADWTTLISLGEECLNEPSLRPRLLVMAAVASLQLGLIDKARSFIEYVQRAGVSSQLLARVLISSVHISLARAAILAGDRYRSVHHLERAVELVGIDAKTRIEVRDVLREHLIQLGATDTQVARRSHAYDDCKQDFKVEQVCSIDLGVGWAGNTINTVIFRHHGILTWGVYQFTAFYVDEQCMRVVRRELTTNYIDTFDIKGSYNLRDAHNSISLGVDRDGYLHICYDHHATRLRYRRGLYPQRIDGWTDELPMTGSHEHSVTYPAFILPRSGYPLTLLYRDGVHCKGSARIKTYNEVSQTWSDRSVPIFSGAKHEPWTSNAYWNHPAIGTDGSLHLSFVWRTDMIGEQKLVNNVNLGYVWSPDNGFHWFTAHGRACKLPITQVNAEVIWALPMGSNLINQSSMALDSHNRPHIVFYANDARGIPQYQHLWFDGNTWEHEYVSDRNMPFELRGGGTLQIPISRPEIVIDQEAAYMIFRSDTSNQRLSVVCVGPKRYQQPPKYLWQESLGFAEPVIDRTRWERERILTIFVQNNCQPNGDREVAARFDSARLVDICLRSIQ